MLDILFPCLKSNTFCKKKENCVTRNKNGTLALSFSLCILTSIKFDILRVCF